MGRRTRRSERAWVLEELEREDPDAYTRLVDLRRYNPQGYRKAVHRLVRRGAAALPERERAEPERLPVNDAPRTPDAWVGGTRVADEVARANFEARRALEERRDRERSDGDAPPDEEPAPKKRRRKKDA